MRLPRLPSATLLLLVIGCNNQTFELSVTNKTDRPLTIGVVKDGPPYEVDLASPGELAVDTRLDTLPPWGHLIPPGRTIDSGKVTGTFPSGTRAYLRVYSGEHSNAELIAIGEPSYDRIDVLLFPGRNDFIIENDLKNGMIAKRLNPTPAPR